jgi:hypothetical protein
MIIICALRYIGSMHFDTGKVAFISTDLCKCTFNCLRNYTSIGIPIISNEIQYLKFLKLAKECRILRRIFEPMRKERTGGCRKHL